MPFHEISRPNPDQIIEMPEPHEFLMASVPPLQLYSSEIAFWRGIKKDADQAGAVGTRRAAEESMRALRSVARERIDLETMLQGSHYDVETAGHLYAHSLLSVAHTRLLRELVETTDPAGLGYNAQNVGVAVDFSVVDIYRSGIHTTPSYMEGQLGIEPPAQGEIRHYEGEAVYLRATAPAQPTETLLESFQRYYQEPFDPSKYVSIVPRLKADFWRGRSTA